MQHLKSVVRINEKLERSEWSNAMDRVLGLTETDRVRIRWNIWWVTWLWASWTDVWPDFDNPPHSCPTENKNPIQTQMGMMSYRLQKCIQLCYSFLLGRLLGWRRPRANHRPPWPPWSLAPWFFSVGFEVLLRRDKGCQVEITNDRPILPMSEWVIFLRLTEHATSLSLSLLSGLPFDWISFGSDFLSTPMGEE